MPTCLTSLQSCGRARVLVARALEFIVLTACWTGEALGAVWSEIAGDTWAIPPARTKTGVEHRVPLSSRAIEILEALPRDRSDFLFIGGAGKPLNRHAMHDLLGLMGRPCTVHGFRASFALGLQNAPAMKILARETALGHSILGKVARAYSRGSVREAPAADDRLGLLLCQPTCDGECRAVAEARRWMIGSPAASKALGPSAPSLRRQNVFSMPAAVGWSGQNLIGRTLISAPSFICCWGTHCAFRLLAGTLRSRYARTHLAAVG